MQTEHGMVTANSTRTARTTLILDIWTYTQRRKISCSYSELMFRVATSANGGGFSRQCGGSDHSIPGIGRQSGTKSLLFSSCFTTRIHVLE
jgi:hypothetical protein